MMRALSRPAAEDGVCDANRHASAQARFRGPNGTLAPRFECSGHQSPSSRRFAALNSSSVKSPRVVHLRELLQPIHA